MPKIAKNVIGNSDSVKFLILLSIFQIWYMSKNKLTKFVKSINLFKIYDGLNESKV